MLSKEHEASFLDIDKPAYRAQLKSLGATCIKPETLMRRVVFDTGPHSFLRVRDEGDRIVMTFKQVANLSLTGVNESNVAVSDYDDAITILQSSGLRLKSRQETLREIWHLDGVEITIDTWSQLPPYTEIEGPTPTAVEKVATKLGFNMQDALYGSVDEIYHRYYGVPQDAVNSCPEIVLGKVPAFLEGKIPITIP